MTRILVLSDIHGNAHAMEAVLQNAPTHDQLLCLGDVVGYGARPNECCEMLRERGAICLLGNHDAAVLGQLSTEWFNLVAKAAVQWTQAQLSEENHVWLQGLSPDLDFPKWNFQAVHGSLRAPLEEYITGEISAQPNFALMKRPLCFFGHTHVAGVFEEFDRPKHRYRLDETVFPGGGEIELLNDWKYLVNPGSVGQPRDGNPQARAAIFDVEAQKIEVRAFEYDVEAAKNAIIDAGLPSQLGHRLLYGM